MGLGVGRVNLMSSALALGVKLWVGWRTLFMVEARVENGFDCARRHWDV